MDVAGPAELVARLHGVLDELAGARWSGCSDADLVAVAASTERAAARLSAVGDAQIVEASDRDLPRRCGFRSLSTFVTTRLRVSDAGRRRRQIAATGRFRTVSGECRAPECPTLADALSAGAVGAGHVRAVLDVLDRIPAAVGHDVRVAAERQMTEIACAHSPADITSLGQRLLAHLDPDGTLTGREDRARRRELWVGRQQADGMSRLSGLLDPLLRARLDVLLAAWAAPGMNNPDDEHSPHGSPDRVDTETLTGCAERDSRSQPQRNHDALNALLTATLDDGLLGHTHRGVPIQLIITASLDELTRQSGVATSHGGSLLPLDELPTLIESAATRPGRLQPWLALFAGHTSVPLYLGRARRTATLGQRLALFAAPGGDRCSCPGCDQPAAHCEIHHATRDFADGGLTDIDALTIACPRHNRMVGNRPGQYRTHTLDTGRTAWTLTTDPGAPANPARINHYPDIGRDFTRTLAGVRTQLHHRKQPPHSTQAPP